MPERVRVALIGAGRIGQRHAATLASAIPRAELAIIADVHGPSAATLAAKVRCQHWTDNPESVLADATINAIVIASSTDSHAPLIVAAAEAGKQIFCEKPIALDLEATDRAIHARERAVDLVEHEYPRRRARQLGLHGGGHVVNVLLPRPDRAGRPRANRRHVATREPVRPRQAVVHRGANPLP